MFSTKKEHKKKKIKFISERLSKIENKKILSERLRKK